MDDKTLVERLELAANDAIHDDVANAIGAAILEIARLDAENFILAAGSCDVEGGKIGDEHGHFRCSLQSRIEALEARLEIDPSQPYDGIYTRDETIRLLDTRIEELKDANKKAALDLLAALGQSTELMDRVRVLEDTINKIQLRTTSHPDDTPDDDKRDKSIANMLARHVMKND